MIIKASSLEALRKGYNRAFEDGRTLGRSMQSWMKIARRTTSSGKAEVYGWLDAVPLMRKWDRTQNSGKRVVKSIKEKAYELANDEFEDTIGVLATDIKDDKYGTYRFLMEEMGQEGETHIDAGCFAALAAGKTSAISDGKNFFAADHPVAANADGTGANTPTSNIYTPADTTGPAWFLVYAMGVHRPIIYQEREALSFNALDNYNDSTVWLQNEFFYGTYCRRAFGYGRWQFAIMSQTDLTIAHFRAARTQMRSLKRDGGRPWRIRPTLLVVPPALESSAKDTIMADRLANGSTNTEYNAVEIHVEELLAA